MAGDDTTRTPDPNDADAANAASETTETDGRTDDYQKRQALEHKVKAEKLNAMMAKLGVSTPEELDAVLSQPPANRDEQRAEDDPRAERLKRLKAYAASGDAAAEDLLELREEIREQFTALAQGVGRELTLRDIPDADLRERARAHMKRRGVDLTSALAEIRQVDLEATNQKLTAELAALRKKPDPDIVNAPKTHGREIPAGEPTTKTMRISEFDAKIEDLTARGQHHEALLLKRQLNRREIVLAKG